jgi:hypothetical protein
VEELSKMGVDSTFALRGHQVHTLGTKQHNAYTDLQKPKLFTELLSCGEKDPTDHFRKRAEAAAANQESAEGMDDDEETDVPEGLVVSTRQKRGVDDRLALSDATELQTHDDAPPDAAKGPRSGVRSVRGGTTAAPSKAAGEDLGHEKHPDERGKAPPRGKVSLQTMAAAFKADLSAAEACHEERCAFARALAVSIYGTVESRRTAIFIVGHVSDTDGVLEIPEEHRSLVVKVNLPEGSIGALYPIRPGEIARQSMSVVTELPFARLHRPEQ